MAQTCRHKPYECGSSISLDKFSRDSTSGRRPPGRFIKPSAVNPDQHDALVGSIVACATLSPQLIKELDQVHRSAVVILNDVSKQSLEKHPPRPAVDESSGVVSRLLEFMFLREIAKSLTDPYKSLAGTEIENVVKQICKYEKQGLGM